MYYLRKVTNDDDVAVYKHNKYARFYRQTFVEGVNPVGMKLYTCKTLRNILGLRQDTYDHCGQWFDVYDENGKVELDEVGVTDDGTA